MNRQKFIYFIILLCLPALSCTAHGTDVIEKEKAERPKIEAASKPENAEGRGINENPEKARSAQAKEKPAKKPRKKKIAGVMVIRVKGAAMRLQPSDISPVVAMPKKGERVKILKSAQGWCLVENKDGFIGWCNKDAIR